jgi:hypothetical protein
VFLFGPLDARSLAGSFSRRKHHVNLCVALGAVRRCVSCRLFSFVRERLVAFLCPGSSELPLEREVRKLQWEKDVTQAERTHDSLYQASLAGGHPFRDPSYLVRSVLLRQSACSKIQGNWSCREQVPSDSAWIVGLVTA